MHLKGKATPKPPVGGRPGGRRSDPDHVDRICARTDLGMAVYRRGADTVDNNRGQSDYFRGRGTRDPRTD